MASFPQLSVLESLEASLAAATHLEPKHAAAVGAARALAAKIDAWDVIVQWALDDASQHENSRPAVPANDNTSLGTYARYLEQLALTVPAVKNAPAARPADPAPAPVATGAASISSLQDRVARRTGR